MVCSLTCLTTVFSRSCNEVKHWTVGIGIIIAKTFELEWICQQIPPLMVRRFASRVSEICCLFPKLLDWFCFWILLFLYCFLFPSLSPSYVIRAVYTNTSVFAFRSTIYGFLQKRMFVLFYIIFIVSFSVGEREKWKAVDRLKWL